MGHLINFIVGWIIICLILFLILIKSVLLWDWYWTGIDTEDFFSDKIYNDIILKW